MELDPTTRILIGEVAEETSKRVVREVLVSLGIDTSEPIEVQKDLAALRELRALMASHEMQADLMHLRRWRKNMNAIQSKGILSAVAFLTAAGLVLFWDVIKLKLGG